MYKGITIAPDSFRLYFWRAKPGYEADVLQQLHAATADVNHSAWHALGFGDYDLVSILKGDDARKAIAEFGTVPHIAGTREVVCFQPHIPTNSVDLLAVLRQHAFCCVTFVQMPGFFTDTSGADAEQRFLLWWRESHRASNAAQELLLGTLGGPEFVIACVGDSLVDVYEQIATRGLGDVPAKKTFSVITTGSDTLLAATEKTPRPLDLGRGNDRLAVQLRISCRPEHVATLLALAHERLRPSTTPTDSAAQKAPGTECDATPRFRSTAHLAGAEDFAITRQLRADDCVGTFVDRVLRFRRDARDLLLGTMTTFRYGEDSINTDTDSVRTLDQCINDMNQRRLPVPQVHVSKDEAAKIWKLADVGPSVLRSLHQYGNMLRNELYCDDLIDMCAYFESCQQQALGIDPTDAHAMALLDARLAPAHIGVEQRTTGAHAGVNPVESNARHLLGGIHRILQAAEAIPLSIARAFDDRVWGGFAIIGTFKHYWIYQYQVIALPPGRMWIPSTWTELGHESVHGIVQTTARLFSASRNQAMAKAMHRLIKDTSVMQSLGATANPLAVAEDYIVDPIEFRMGPHWDPELMLRAWWQYASSTLDLTTVGQEKAYQLTTRALLLWASLNEGHMWATEAPDQMPDLAEHWRELRKRNPQWQEIGERVRLMYRDHIEEDKLFNCCNALWPIHRFAVRDVRFTNTDMAKRKEWWFGAAKECTRQVARGVTITKEDIHYPELFVWCLCDQFGENMSVSQRTSAVLGLADWYRDAWLAVREQIVAAHDDDTMKSTPAGQ